MFLSIRDSQTHHVQADGLAASHARTLQHLGITAVEVWLAPDGALTYWQKPDGSPRRLDTVQDAQDFKRELDEQGIQACALCLPTDFAAHPEHTAWATRAVELAPHVGAACVRIDTATHDGSLSMQEVSDRFCRAIEQVLGATSELGLPLGIENHGTMSNDAAFLDGIFARVGDERLGLTLDPGNFYWFGLPLEEVYATCEKYAPRTSHTHFKNIAYPLDIQAERREPGFRYNECVAPLGRGDLDMARVLAILKKSGYAGDVCIEDESLGHFASGEQLQVLQEDAECLRAAIA